MKKQYKILLNAFLMFSIVCSYKILPQQLPNSFESISMIDGLSNNDIWSIVQDRYGYMWIATGDGLNRYDGYNFTVYKNNPADSTTLPSNLVTRVIEDHEGTIWVSTSNGLSRFNRKTETFKNYKFVNSNAERANYITFIFEDSKDNIWINVSNSYGIQSFDKKSETFKHYDVLKENNVVGNSTGAAFNTIQTKAGELLFSSAGLGLLKFDYENKLLIQLKLKNNLQNNLIGKYVNVMYEDSDGNIWYGPSNALYKIDIKNLTGSEVINSLTGKTFSLAGGLYEDKKGKIWIGTDDELYQYDLKTKKSIKLPVQGYKNYYCFYMDRNDLLWMGSISGVLKYNFDKAPFELYNFISNVNQEKPVAVSLDKSKKYKNLIWLGTSKGLYTFDKVKHTIDKALSVASKIPDGNNLQIHCLIEDNNNKLFLGTGDNGLFVFNLGNGNLGQYKPILYDQTSLRFNPVNVLFEDSENQIWVGQQHGLSIFNEKQKDFKRIPNFLFRQYNNNLISFLHKLRKDRTPLLQMIDVGDFANLSKEFLLTKDSYLLISCIGEGLPQVGMADYGWLQSIRQDTLWTMKDLNKTFRASGAFKNRQKIGILNLKKGRYKLNYITDDSHSVQSFNATPPQDSIYWGIEIYTLSEDEFQKYHGILNDEVNSDFMKGNNVHAIYESKDKKIWVATYNGVSIIDPKTLSVKNISMDSKKGLSISNNSVEDICEDNSGNIWIATQDGLNKYDNKKNKIIVYREKDGLPTSNLKSIQLDNEGNLWISSIKGITKVETSDSSKTPIFINYDVRDGLQGYTFIGNASLKDTDGKMYFSGTDGFNAFIPGPTDKTLPNIVMNNISVSNKTVDELYGNLLDTKDLNSIKEIDLPYDQNDISFEFASVQFARPDKNRTKYMMVGVDQNWNLSNRRFASYTNLDPGDYVFKVEGSNGDGIWNENAKQIKIHISPPWFSNWTAYSIYAVVFFGFLYGIRKFEMGRQQKNAQLKETRLRAEAAELQAKAAEAERKVLESENLRKSKELEEARELQLSMLPKSLPNLPHLDIAVYMKTATEVGGDYYDFHVGLDGTLTVVVGDATGHGMKAGTMVTSTKSLFNALAPNPNIIDTFHEITRCLKLMHLEKLSMCMTMLKIIENKVQMSSAGMPPVLFYQRENQAIEELVMKGMPLGTFDDFPYVLKERDLNSGDVILIVSDGLPELFNEKKEMFGYKRMRNIFEESANKNPEEIIKNLKDAGSEWVKDKDPDDDVTFVVIKVK